MSRTTKLLLPVLVVMAVGLAYWFLLLAPKRDEAAKLQTQVAGKQQEVTQSEALAGTYEQSRKAYKRNYATVVRLGKAVPADDDVRSLMVQLDTTAKRSKVDFRTFSLSSSASPAGNGGATVTTTASSADTPPPGAVAVGTANFWAEPFNLSFQGGFFRLSNFMSNLERFVTVSDQRVDVTGRLLRVESFTLEPDDQNWKVIHATIGATSYIVPPAQGLTGNATPAGPGATTTPPSGGTTPTTTTATATAGVIR